MEGQCVFWEAEPDIEYCLFEQIEQTLEKEMHAVGTGVNTTNNDFSMLVFTLV